MKPNVSPYLENTEASQHESSIKGLGQGQEERRREEIDTARCSESATQPQAATREGPDAHQNEGADCRAGSGPGAENPPLSQGPGVGERLEGILFLQGCQFAVQAIASPTPTSQ